MSLCCLKLEVLGISPTVRCQLLITGLFVADRGKVTELLAVVKSGVLELAGGGRVGGTTSRAGLHRRLRRRMGSFGGLGWLGLWLMSSVGAKVIHGAAREILSATNGCLAGLGHGQSLSKVRVGSAKSLYWRCLSRRPQTKRSRSISSSVAPHCRVEQSFRVVQCSALGY